mmetsp:Transcript_13422/g.26349  ORF Transcript_13422/g.26349 Transcript_13422/m.26349 type:complete len:585 (+) Transcript_13422:74-1828(+)
MACVAAVPPEVGFRSEGRNDHFAMCMENEAEAITDPTDQGVPRMSLDALKEACLRSGGYDAPELNELLHLSYKGFRKIECLQPYTAVCSLFLECNGIRRLENLRHMTNLKSLYLQSNCIERIENLEALTSLRLLNLAHNSISSVEGLATLTSLETINLAANKLTDVESLAGLAERPTLRTVDISCNYVEDGDGLLEFWPTALPSIECLYVHHNSCSRYLKDVRRRLISKLPKLRWLDERPVTPVERVGCEAWATGGREAEQAAKVAHWQEEDEAKMRSFENFKRLQKVTAERARIQREEKAAREAARCQASEELKDTGALADGWVALPSGQDACKLAGDAKGARQKALRAKVDEFFASKEESEKQENHSGSCTVATAPVSLLDVALAECAKEVVADDENLASCSLATADEEDRTAPFQWSSFRDTRLGRLVAEFRYDFGRAAAALGKEFGNSVTEQECRNRYRELIRPNKTRAEMRADDRGRAKDGPAADPAMVREIQEWWLKRSSPSQASKEAESTSRWEAAALAAPEEAAKSQSLPEPAKCGAHPGSCAPDPMCDVPKPEADVMQGKLASDKHSNLGLFELD